MFSDITKLTGNKNQNYIWKIPKDMDTQEYMTTYPWVKREIPQ